MLRRALTIFLLLAAVALAGTTTGMTVDASPSSSLAGTPTGSPPAAGPWPQVTWERVMDGDAWWQDGLTCTIVTSPGPPPVTETHPCNRITALVPDPVTPGLFYLVEKSGRIYLVRRTVAGTLEPVEPNPGPAGGAIPWLDISDRVRSDARELGLYGMLFGPDTTGARTHFYLFYTRTPQLPDQSDSGAMVLARFPWSTHTVKPLPAQEAIMTGPGGPFVVHRPTISNVSPFCLAPETVLHAGGGMAWGNDGLLYIGVGDGGCQKDEPNYAQNTDPASPLSTNRRLFLGKLLRLAPSPTAATWTIPATNPLFPGMTTPTEVFAAGLRNPWKLDRDTVSGNMYLVDTGERALEEVNLVPFPASPSRNYGWACYEGPNPTPGRSPNPPIADPCTPGLAASRTDPIATFGHDACGNGAITGGLVYRSAANPAWQGLYFYANFLHVLLQPPGCSFSGPVTPGGQLYALRPATGGGFESTQLATTGLAISAFGRDDCGNLYFGEFFSGDVYRLTGPDYVDPCSVVGYTVALPFTSRGLSGGW